ncbi:PDZ domain-containing protein [Lysobacter cavernae]|uniref:PDZ domain-containing protein n=1 Tax=Lysobacter cavernae TaxID=1685901 RepID=A0ABV7RSX7_9GAMM
MKLPSSPSVYATGLALALTLAGGTYAQATDADEKALASARADLDRASQRVSELSRKLGRPTPAVVIERRAVRKPVLGVVLSPDAQRGVHIAAVTPNSGAANAGLRSGDRIVSIEGKAIAGQDGLARAVSARTLLGDIEASQPVTLGYERDGKPTLIKVMPQLGERIVVMRDAPVGVTFGGAISAQEHVDGRIDIEADSITVDVSDQPGSAQTRRKAIRHDARNAGGADAHAFVLETAPGIAPEVQREIVWFGPEDSCKGDDCRRRLPLLTEAFRWNGLNLASVDAQLGRYFGTDRGVLVLSAGPELVGLQTGDVIHSIDGKAVASPREAMAALRGKPAGSKANVAYLRDRKPATAQVSVPKAMPLRLPPVPPAPPAPLVPPAPTAPPAAPVAPPSLPAPPTPPTPPVAPPPQVALVL